METRRSVSTKLKRTFQNAVSAWWVLLIMVGYMVFAWRFLGTSCLLASTTGLPCPGCGITRATLALLRGDFAESLRFFPMLIPSFAFVIVYAAAWLTHEKLPRRMEQALVVFAAILLYVYAVRMALMFPREVPMVFNDHAVSARIFYLFR